MKLLLTEISVHTGNICSDIQNASTSLRSVIRLECQNKYFRIQIFFLEQRRKNVLQLSRQHVYQASGKIGDFSNKSEPGFTIF